MQPTVKLEVNVDHAHREIAVAGELDIATRSSVSDATAELNSSGEGDINLDLDDVTFIDAAGVGAVVAAHNRQAANHTALLIRSSSRGVERVFAICGLAWMLQRWTRSTASASSTDDEDRSDDDRLQRALRAHIAQLELALHTARRISAATGILMATRKLSYDAAFSLLSSESQNSNRKLRDVAEAVIRTGAMT